MRKCFLSQINIQLPYNYKGACSIAVAQQKLLDGLAFLTKTLLLLNYLFLVALITLYKCVCDLVAIEED